MRTFRLVFLAFAAWTPLVATQASADTRTCQKALAKASSVLTKQAPKRLTKCLDNENSDRVPGPCPDPVTTAKLGLVRQKVEAKIAKACALSDAAALGFPGSCSLAFPEGSAAEATCSALPVTTSAEFATCLTCWQRADLFELTALLYASHAIALCGGTVGLESSTCSQGGCAAVFGPTPDQRDLDGSEYDCQRAIAKSGISYFSKRAKLLGRCAFGGGSREACLGDPKTQLRLASAAAKRTKRVVDRCRNLRPVANAPFCCRTAGNSCVAVADRDACAESGGQVQEGKVCGLANRCDNVPGGPTVTWWSQCPLRACGNFSVANLTELDACVQGKADETADALLCYRFPGGSWPCPSSPSGAFLDVVQ